MKFSEFGKKFKEIWSVPRYRASIKLGLWVLFFVFVALYARTSDYIDTDNTNKNNNNNTNTTVVDLEEFKKIDNYNFILTYTGDEEEIVITGKNYENRTSLIYNSKTYYIEDKVLYSIKNGFIDSKIKPEFMPIRNFYLLTSDIYDLIKLGTLESETKKVQENIIEKKYVIATKDILQKYEGIILEHDDTNVTVTTYEKAGKIDKIEIDFASLQRFPGFFIGKKHIITIKYSEMGNVLPFSYHTREELESGE